MLNKTNTTNEEAAIFRKWYVSKSVEEAQNIKNEILRELDWDRNKWFRMLHGKTQWTTAERIAVEKVAAERIWP